MPDELKILILEDEPTDAELAIQALRKAGIAFSFRRVDTRDGFVAALDEYRPDIVLADYHLPAFAGLEALTIALKQVPDVPFIFVSGTMGEEFAIETLHQGAADYVIKNRLGKLAPAVRRALLEAKERRLRHRAEQELAASEERFRKIAESMQDGMIIVDENSSITYWNRAAEKCSVTPPQKYWASAGSRLLLRRSIMRRFCRMRPNSGRPDRDPMLAALWNCRHCAKAARSSPPRCHFLR